MIVENGDCAKYVFEFPKYILTVEKEVLKHDYKVITENKTNGVIKTKSNLEKKEIESLLKTAKNLK